MGTYAVTLTSRTDQPVTELEALHDSLADFSPALSYSEDNREVGATLAIDADDMDAALDIAYAAWDHVWRAAGAGSFRHTEVNICEWELHERRLAESNLPDLVSATEAAEILGVTRQRVHQMISETPTFPPPLLRLGSGPLWLRATIEAYSKIPRRAGRPRLADTPVDELATVARDTREKMRQAAGARGKP